MIQELLKRYIAGDATQTEKDEIARWAKSDKSNMSELLALRKLYDIAIWKENEKYVDREKRAKRITIYRLSAVAAVFLLLAASNWYFFSASRKVPEVIMQTIRVPAGQRAELTLTDGTSVWLNAGSTFIFPNHFEADKRVVSLDGEGYFDVETDTQKPFIVKTSSYDIEALGTTFNVFAYQKSPLFEVSLLQGEIEVYAGNARIKPQPEEKIFLSNNQLIKERIQNYNYLLWKDGLICFEDEPVDRMVSKLKLYFDTNIIIKNASFMKKKYTGKFRTKDGIEHILKVFQLKDNFLYEKDDVNNLITIK